MRIYRKYSLGIQRNKITREQFAVQHTKQIVNREPKTIITMFNSELKWPITHSAFKSLTFFSRNFHLLFFSYFFNCNFHISFFCAIFRNSQSLNGILFVFLVPCSSSDSWISAFVNHYYCK